MKKAIHLLLTTLVLHMLILGAGCKKDKADQDPTGKYSFSNSEYTGIAQVGNHYFPRPLSLRFGAGDDVTAWSHLTLNKWHRGDIPGKITKVEENGQGQTMVTVLFDLPGEEQFNSPQVFTISADRSKITGGSSPIIAMVDMKLYPKDTYNIVGIWAQPEHPQWFPDVNVIKFFSPEGWTNYIQNGIPVLTRVDSKLLWEYYKQDGSRITFAGIDPSEPIIKTIPYYGVLSADGKILYVDAYDFASARLTASLSTFDTYGPKGVTPWLLRQKTNP